MRMILLSVCVLGCALLHAQATLLADINTSPSTRDPAPTHFVTYNGKVYFAAAPAGGTGTLLVTDGTVAGSGIADPVPMNVGNLCVVGGWLYFSAAAEPSTGNQLWRSSGQPGGSIPVTSYATH